MAKLKKYLELKSYLKFSQCPLKVQYRLLILCFSMACLMCTHPNLGLTADMFQVARVSTHVPKHTDFAKELQSCHFPDVKSYKHEISEFEIECMKGAETKILDPISGNQVKVQWRKDLFLRENGFRCVDGSCSGAWNRLRQVALGIIYARNVLSCFGSSLQLINSVHDLRSAGLQVWDTQSTGPFVDVFSGTNGYVSSEYVSESVASGEFVVKSNRRIRHENIMNSSFPASSLDLVISSEVLEHVPFPYAAHEEIFRVLRKGGAHIFSVPYDVTSEQDIETARLLPNKSIVFTGDPIFHGDPMRPEGIIVFNIFGNEMVRRLCQIGFEAHFLEMSSSLHGVTGTGAFIFVVVKR